MIQGRIKAIAEAIDQSSSAGDNATAPDLPGCDAPRRRPSAGSAGDPFEELRRDTAFQPFLGRPGGLGGKPTVFVRSVAKGNLPIGFGRVARSNQDLTMDGLRDLELSGLRIMPMTSRRGLADWTGHGREPVNERPTLPDVALVLPRTRRKETTGTASTHPFVGPTSGEPRLRHVLRAEVEVRRILARPAPGESDRALAVDLLAGMAALKCDLGLAESCVREYVLMTRICLGLGDRPRAVASMRRALACAHLSHDRGDLREATANAFDTYLALGHVGPARRALCDLDRIPSTPGDPSDSRARAAALDELDRPDATPPAVCAGCGAASYTACCGLADRDPVEIAMYFTADRRRRPLSPFGEDSGSGLSQLMDAEGGHRDRDMFLVWRHVGGRWELDTIPDLAERHMAIARAMRDRAVSNPGSSEGPTCAVTFAVAALEAFINMTTYFVALEGRDAWAGSPMPDQVFKDLARYQQSKNCKIKWREIGDAMLGREWLSAKRRTEFHRLVQLRNDIMHYNAAEVEALQVDVEESHQFVRDLRRVVSPRPAPAHWLDRVLTHKAAGWAVSTAEELMSSFRGTFQRRSRCRADG